MAHTTPTAQEAFWSGQGGTDYIGRNKRIDTSSRLHFFSRVLRRAPGVASVLELGANIGLNLHALHALLPEAHIEAVEINPDAAASLRRLPFLAQAHQASLLSFTPSRAFDLVFTRGVLIHIEPARLPDVYDLMHRASSRYLLVAEYFNPKPVEVTYQGREGLLFKRDFAGELLDRFPDLALVAYDFIYRRDPVAPADDITWFLLEKRG